MYVCMYVYIYIYIYMYIRLESGHHLGEIVDGGKIQSWVVYGQLSNISINIASRVLRAGAQSDITIELMSAVWGDTLEILFIEPPNFEFDECRPDSPFERDPRTLGGRLILIGGSLEPGRHTKITLSAVRMGTIGGQTRVDMRLYNGQAMTNQVAVRLNEVGGFRLAGDLRVLNQRFWNQPVVDHYELGGAALDPILPLVPAHATSPVRLDLLFSVTKFVLRGEELILRSMAFIQDYTPAAFKKEAQYAPILELCHDTTEAEATSNEESVNGPMHCNVTSMINISSMAWMGDMVYPEGVRLLLNESSPLNNLSSPLVSDHDRPILEGGLVYRLRVWVVTNTAPLFWSFLTSDGQTMPTNTNDGLSAAMGTAVGVTVMSTPYIERAPPRSAIFITLNFRMTDFAMARAALGGVPEIQVIPPLGFVPFGSTMQKQQESERLLLSLDPARAVSGDIYTEEGWTFQLRMVTPDITPKDTRWFILALQEESKQLLGWGFADGYNLTALPIRLTYAALPLQETWAVVAFEVYTEAKAVWAIISAPQLFQVVCPTKDEVVPSFPCEPISGMTDGFGVGTGSVDRSVNVTLSNGRSQGVGIQYAMILKIITPKYPNFGSTWQVRVLNGDNVVVDSNLQITGPTFMEDMWVDRPRNMCIHIYIYIYIYMYVYMHMYVCR